MGAQSNPRESGALNMEFLLNISPADRKL